MAETANDPDSRLRPGSVEPRSFCTSRQACLVSKRGFRPKCATRKTSWARLYRNAALRVNPTAQNTLFRKPDNSKKRCTVHFKCVAAFSLASKIEKGRHSTALFFLSQQNNDFNRSGG
jgi:hypothetical protein